MAIDAGQIVFKIIGDSSGLGRSLDQANAKVSKTSGGFLSFAMSMKLAAAAAVYKIVEIGKSILKSASDAEETNAKYGEVFSNIAEKANKAAAEVAASFQLSRTAAKNLIAGVGDIAIGLGATQEQALTLGVNVTKLGADLASFTNYSGGAKGAAEALTKAMLGEYEQMKSLGRAMSDDTLKLFAASQGKVYDKMGQLEKMTLRYNYAVKLSQNAIGDLARTSGSFANQSRQLTEVSIPNLEASIGAGLIPIASLALKVFNDFAEELDANAQEFSKWIKSAEGAEVVGDKIGSVLGFLAYAFQIIKPAIDGFVEGIETIIDNIMDFSLTSETAGAGTVILAGVFERLGITFKIIGNTIGFMVTLFSNLIQIIFDAGTAFGAFFKLLSGKGTWEEFKQQTGQLGDSVKLLAGNTTGYIKDQVNNIKDLVGKSGENAEKNALLASAAYQKMSASAKEATMKALMADQAAAKIKKENLNKEGGNLKDYLEMVKKKVADFNLVIGAISNVITGAGALVAAVFKSQIDALDDEKKARYEAAGVAEETEIMKAKAEVAEAEASGNAVLIGEKRRILEKAKIDEEFAKKKAKLEYEGAMVAWELNIATATAQMAIGIASAVASGAQFGVAAIAMMPIMGALAGVAGALQLAAVIAAKPKAPSFAMGGIVPGSSYSGDRVTAQVNSGEMILNQSQQKNLLNVASTGGETGTLYRVAPIRRQTFFDELFKASQNGELFIAARGVMA